MRGQSMFGMSFVYVIFEDGTDIYWARSRVLEYLSAVRGHAARGRESVLGPDATGVGWVFEYALVDKTGEASISPSCVPPGLVSPLRAGAVRRGRGRRRSAASSSSTRSSSIRTSLLAYGIPSRKWSTRSRTTNGEVGGRVLEVAGTSTCVRGRGYVKTRRGPRERSRSSERRHAVYVSDVGTVHLGPESAAASPSSTARAKSSAASS